MAPKPSTTAAGKAKSPASKPAAKNTASPAKKVARPAAKSTKTAVVSKEAKAAPGKKKVAASKAPKWTPEQVAAGTKIQAQIRGHLCRKKIKNDKEKKAKMDEEMEKLRQQAFLVEVQYERKQREKKSKKNAEDAAKRKKEAKLKKDMLEAAFDGEDGDLNKLFREAADIFEYPVDVADGHGNTLLSEAAAGGALSTVRLLLGMGANPNTQGEFKRSPLWRAAFLGKQDCVVPLLEGGADPRIPNEAGELPAHVCNPATKEIILAWDESQTDTLVAKFEAMMIERAAEKQATKRMELQSAEEELEAALEAHERAQKDLKKTRMEVERLIYEYDTLVGESKPQSFIDVAAQAIHDQEANVEKATKLARAAAETLQNARLELREKSSSENNEEEELPGMLIRLKELDDVLIKDVGDRLLNSGKWPAIIDVSGQASVFLRYMDTNYVNALNINQIEPNKLRRSILGSIRYGKPCVVDIMDVDMWDELVKLFDQVEPGLLAKILDKSLMKSDGYLRLVRPGDGEDYEPNKFQEIRVKNFKFVLLTSARQPGQRIIDSMYAIRIRVEQ